MRRTTLQRVGKLLLILMLLLIFLYGCILIGIGCVLHRALQDAKANWRAIPVRVTEISSAEQAPFWYVVGLKPLDVNPQAVPPLGDTYAATLNRSLHIGSELMMYYDPNHPETRTVDFGETPMLFVLGGGLMGVPMLLGLFFLVRYCQKRSHRTPTVEMTASVMNINDVS